MFTLRQRLMMAKRRKLVLTAIWHVRGQPTRMKTRATADGWGESRKPGSRQRSVAGRGKERRASSEGITSISSIAAGNTS
jgi:hypothetical protein